MLKALWNVNNIFFVVESPSWVWLCDTMNWSMPGLPVPHHLPNFAQVHIHCIGDASQASHSLVPSSPSALNLSQHQGIFQWVSCSHQMTKIPEFQLQHQSFQWVFRVDFPLDWLVLSPCCPRDPQKSSPAPQFEGINSSALNIFYYPVLTSYMTPGKTIVLTIQTFVAK